MEILNKGRRLIVPKGLRSKKMREYIFRNNNPASEVCVSVHSFSGSIEPILCGSIAVGDCHTICLLKFSNEEVIAILLSENIINKKEALALTLGG